MNTNKREGRVGDFVAERSVFTHDEFERFLDQNGTTGRRAESLLRYYVDSGRLLHPRRGLYVTASRAPDPYLVASRLSDDAVLAYHSALALHGRAHSVSHRFLFLTRRAVRPFTMGGERYEAVAFPKRLREAGQELFGVETADRQGQDVRVTSLERTLVDVLDRPDLGGGWEEVWRSLESVAFFDLESVIEYALLLGNRTTIAKVGFYLEQHQDVLMVEEAHLRRLSAHRPSSRLYMDRGIGGAGQLQPRWNLIVPEATIQRSWEDFE